MAYHLSKMGGGEGRVGAEVWEGQEGCARLEWRMPYKGTGRKAGMAEKGFEIWLSKLLRFCFLDSGQTFESGSDISGPNFLWWHLIDLIGRGSPEAKHPLMCPALYNGNWGPTGEKSSWVRPEWGFLFLLPEANLI